METNENMKKALLECTRIIEVHQKQITNKIQKEKTSKFVDGSVEYMGALQDLNKEFVEILTMIQAYNASEDKQYSIDVLREKFRVLLLEYNKCSDYSEEKKVLERLMALLLPFISTTQKEIEEYFLKNIKGKITYDSSRLCFDEFAGELKSYMSLSNTFRDFSDETAKTYQKFSQLFKDIQLYIKLINTTKSATQFHKFTYKFLNAKREFKKLALNFDAYIATFAVDSLASEEEADSPPQHKAQTNNVLESAFVDSSSLSQTVEEHPETEQTEQELLEQLLALQPKKAEASTQKANTTKFKQQDLHETKVKHESKTTWQERRLDSYARLLHRTLLCTYHKPGAVSVTIEPNNKQLLISTARNLDEKIIIEATTKITEASSKLEKRLAAEKISLKAHIIERTKYLKDLITKLKNPKEHFNMDSTGDNTPSEYEKFIFLIKNVRMDLDLAKFLQATQTITEQRYFADLHNAITKNVILIVQNSNLLHPEQAIADYLLTRATKKITVYIGSTTKSCKKCHVLFNGQSSGLLNGLNEAGSFLQVRTSGFFDYGYPNTYLPTYVRKSNPQLCNKEISALLDQASPYPARKAEPRALFIAQQSELSDSETELESTSMFNL